MGGGRSATGQVDPTRRHSGCTAETCSTWCSAGSDDAEFNATATCADANLRGRKTTSGKERALNMGLGDWFGTFCSNIQVQDSGTISTRYKAITRRLNTDFWDTTSETAHSLYVGSYGRNTAIQGFSDLDIVFELPSYLYHQYDGYVTNGQSALLQAVRSSMQRTYPTSEMGADGQVVVVQFQDGIGFEVVPVFLNDAGSYTFPDANSGGSWKTTSPRPEIEAIRARNTECNGNLVRLCRMMRSWKKEWSVPLGGLLIDTFAYQFIENCAHRQESYYYYDWMCRDLFNWMADQNEEQTFWRAPGSGQYVYKKGLFQYKAKRCYNLSLEAIAYETADSKKEWSAKQKWREIFGTAFPD